jgi:hypothetical protein
MINDVPYSDITEETDIVKVRARVSAGWMLLDIYHRKKEVYGSDPVQFDEYAVYILGKRQGV